MYQGQHAKAEKPPADSEMIDERGFERRIIIRIEASEAEPVGLGAAVGNAEPDRLNAATRQRHAEEAFALAIIRNCNADNQIIIALNFRPFQEGLLFRSRLVGDAEEMEF